MSKNEKNEDIISNDNSVNDEKTYINNIIEKLFTKDEVYLYILTAEVILKCHEYLRKIFSPSVVSLRDVERFSKCFEFLKNYFIIKNNYEKLNNSEKNNKIRSILCSIYLCYFIRLKGQHKRDNFEKELRPRLLNLINNNEKDEEYKGGNLLEEIKNEDLKKEIISRKEEIRNFSDFLIIEQEYLFAQLELDKGLIKNKILKESVFSIFIALNTRIPLIIIGKPGCGKSLSINLINKSMKGQYSKNKFFELFPRIYQFYFQGSESTQPEDVEKLFLKSEKVLAGFKDKKGQLPITMVFFNELGLAKKSESNPLNVIYSKFEYCNKLEGLSFVGISDCPLDEVNMNRFLVSSLPDIDKNLDDLIETSITIAESISDRLKKDKIFEVLSHTYFQYKRFLQTIKELIIYKAFVSQNNEKEISEIDRKERTFESIKNSRKFEDLLKEENKIIIDFHGYRDFCYLVRGIATKLEDSNIDKDDKVIEIEKYIERNFGGIDYEIDIDFNLILDDIRDKIELIKYVLKDYESYDENKKIKLNSVFLFKKLYNIECDRISPNDNYKINPLRLNQYNLYNCINDSIRDLNSRYLLLEINYSLTELIYHYIKLNNPTENIVALYCGSPFEEDNNKENRLKIINLIQDDAIDNKLIIMENLNQIHPFLFD